MIDTPSLRRMLLYCLIGALAVGAVTGISVFILGDFGELEMKILASTLSLTFFSVTALASTAVLETKRGVWLSGPGLILSLVGLGWSLAVIWPEWDSEPAVKTLVILIILAFSFAQSCLLALPRLKGRLAWLFPAALFCIFGLAGIISVMIVFEWDDELLFRMVGVLGILDACVTLAIPVLTKLTGKATTEAVRPPRDFEGDGLRIQLSCPRCGQDGVYPLGVIDCPRCSLRIRVEVDQTMQPEETGRPPGRFQFSLRAILLAFLVASLPLGWIGYRMDQLRRQAAVIEALAPLNPQVYYRYGNARGITISGSDPATFDASLLARLKDLPELQNLNLTDAPITEDDIVYLEGLDVQWINIESTRLTPESVESLKKSHPNWSLSATHSPSEPTEPAAEPASE